MKKYPVYLLLFLFVFACESDQCIHETGEVKIKRVDSGYFNNLQIHGLFHVILVEDTLNYVEFEGGEKDLLYVFAENTDSILTIRNENTCIFFRNYDKIKAYIYYSVLSRVDVHEASLVESHDSLSHLHYLTVQARIAEINLLLNSSRFGFYNNMTTGGIYKFSGHVDNCWISCYYSGKFITDSLFVRELYLNNSSLSDVYVNAAEKLNVQLLNSGNIYYSGNPEIVIDSINGQGKLLPWIK